MTSDTATLPVPLETNAREAVKSEVVIVDTAPAILFVRLVSAAVNCVCIALVTPSRCPSSVAVTSLTATFPEPLDTNAREAVKSASSM